MDKIISSGIQQAINDSIKNYLGRDFGGLVNKGRENIDIAQRAADFTENIGKKRIDMLTAQGSKAVNEAMLNEESMRSEGLKQNMLRANESLGKWIESQVNKALAENKPILSLEELESQEKSKGSGGKYKALDALTKDTGSIEYQAFQQYIENVQKMQQLQDQIKGNIETMNQKQQEIQQELIKNISSAASSFLSQDKKPENITPNGNIVHRNAYGETVAVTGAPIKQPQSQQQPEAKWINQLEKAILNLKQFPGIINRNNSLEGGGGIDLNTLNQTMSDLSSVIQTSANTQPENLNIDGNINVSPLEIGGNLAISLNAPTFKVEIDDTDLQKTKEEIERSFDQKLQQVSANIMSQVQKGLAESLRQSIGKASGREVPATTDNPFRNYGVGRRSII
ncbi:MAG: hypothetical protein EBR67_11270 [Proteobacteria bacterium]|nr:hypothetical protein [Pseudomonadota bacterium]